MPFHVHKQSTDSKQNENWDLILQQTCVHMSMISIYANRNLFI